MGENVFIAFAGIVFSGAGVFLFVLGAKMIFGIL